MSRGNLSSGKRRIGLGRAGCVTFSCVGCAHSGFITRHYDTHSRLRLGRDYIILGRRGCQPHPNLQSECFNHHTLRPFEPHPFPAGRQRGQSWHTHLRTTSLPATQGGTGARTGTASTRDEQVFAMTGSQVVDLMGGGKLRGWGIRTRP